MIQYSFRIAQRRDASVTKEVSMELDSNKKLTRQEKDERLGYDDFYFLGIYDYNEGIAHFV